MMRHRMAWLAAAFVVGLAVVVGMAVAAESNMTDPPGDESPAMRGLIDKAAALLGATMVPEQFLADPHYMPAHEYPRFRQAIKDHAKPGKLTIVVPDEPGETLTVIATVESASGSPVKDALVYVYQTSAKGWYSDRAPHYAANSGDQKHARLFGYLKTDERGAFELRTIHPQGYPKSDLPAHIHVEITPPGGGAPTITEIRFDDDPRMTDAMKEASRREGFVITHVTKDDKGGLHAETEIDLR
ncbi:MAG: hypothetical protein HY049_00535 [Acidobacteria bacterium]|nr:hypothetical protein [Acidobacteriota bacterium]